jgi:hypothetical protein
LKNCFFYFFLRSLRVGMTSKAFCDNQTVPATWTNTSCDEVGIFSFPTRKLYFVNFNSFYLPENAAPDGRTRSSSCCGRAAASA